MTAKFAGDEKQGKTSLVVPKYLLSRFTMYVAIGACAFAADYSVFLLAFHINGNPYIANVLGICTGITISFSLNSKYNFRRTDTLARRAARFVTVALLGMAISTLMLMLLIGQGIDARIAKVITMFLVFAFQFLMNALWTFR